MPHTAQPPKSALPPADAFGPITELRLPAQVLAGDFAGWLREAMAARGMTQRMLAMRTGIDHSTIARLVSEKRGPLLSTALALMQVLDGDPWQSVPPAASGAHPAA